MYFIHVLLGTSILHSGHSTLHSPISYPPPLSWCPPHLSLEAPPPQGLLVLPRWVFNSSSEVILLPQSILSSFLQPLPRSTGTCYQAWHLKKNRASLPPCFMYVCVYTCTCVLFVCARVCLSALCNLFNGYHSTPDLEYSFLKVW